MTENILHYGLNRSGTNYLKELLALYFDINFINNEDERNNPLHKHFRLYDNKDLIDRENFHNTVFFRNFDDFLKEAAPDNSVKMIAVISKDPYSWDLSYRSWGKKNNWEEPAHPPVLEYNEFYRKWYAFSQESEKIVMIRYMDLLQEPAVTLEYLRKRFNLPLRTELSNIKKIRKVPMSHRFTRKRRRYYTKMRYLDDYSPDALNEINQLIDHDLIKKMGYKSYGI